MKVMDLRCAHGHRFEGWFASDGEWRRQADAGLLTCPMCGDADVQRLPSAPRLNLGPRPVAAGKVPQDGDADAKGPATEAPGSLAVAPQPALSVNRRNAPSQDTAPQDPAQAAAVHLQSLWQAVRSVIDNTQDVGEHFPEEARRIHYGERPVRPIRGQASSDEVEALLDEGIEVMNLPVPAALKGPVQ